MSGKKQAKRPKGHVPKTVFSTPYTWPEPCSIGIMRECISVLKNHSAPLSRKERRSWLCLGINEVVRNVVKGKVAAVLVWKGSVNPPMLIENFPLLCSVYRVHLCCLDGGTEEWTILGQELSNLLDIRSCSVLGLLHSSGNASADALIETVRQTHPIRQQPSLFPLQTYIDHRKRNKIGD